MDVINNRIMNNSNETSLIKKKKISFNKAKLYINSKCIIIITLSF